MAKTPSKKSPRKRNAADATLRNTRAANKRFASILSVMQHLEDRLKESEDRIYEFSARIQALEARPLAGDEAP